MLHRHVRLWSLAVLLVSSGVASAHHGWSWYSSEDFTLSGTVVEKHFGRPHDRLTIEADGRRWNVVLSPPSRSQRANFTADKVEVGDQVTAFGQRHRDAETFEMKTESIRVGDQTYDVYPNRL